MTIPFMTTPMYHNPLRVYDGPKALPPQTSGAGGSWGEPEGKPEEAFVVDPVAAKVDAYTNFVAMMRALQEEGKRFMNPMEYDEFGYRTQVGKQVAQKSGGGTIQAKNEYLKESMVEPMLSQYENPEDRDKDFITRKALSDLQKYNNAIALLSQFSTGRPDERFYKENVDTGQGNKAPFGWIMKDDKGRPYAGAFTALPLAGQKYANNAIRNNVMGDKELKSNYFGYPIKKVGNKDKTTITRDEMNFWREGQVAGVQPPEPIYVKDGVGYYRDTDLETYKQAVAQATMQRAAQSPNAAAVTTPKDVDATEEQMMDVVQQLVQTSQPQVATTSGFKFGTSGGGTPMTAHTPNRGRQASGPPRQMAANQYEANMHPDMYKLYYANKINRGY